MIIIAKNNLKTPNYKDLVLNTIKDRYLYFLLGTVVIITILFIFSGFLPKNKLFPSKKPEKATAQQEQIQEKQKQYIVKAGDDLWHIAEGAYGSGYNAYDIAAANKITNTGLIEVGQTLLLPSVTAKQPTKGEVASAVSSEKVTITGAQYTVQKDDYLWKIALEAYGDGYAWVKIAQANKLTNPDLIHPGNVLILPR